MGGGPSLQALRALKSDLGLDAFVDMPGRVSDEDLNRYLSSADLCLDPDPYSEWADKSTMNKIMEYMAFGKPIVAFDLKEHRFSAQRAAVYAEKDNLEDFANLVIELLSDEERRNEMGRFAIERVQNELAWKFSVPHLLAAYEHVAAVQ
jgi:glycosyltransferase involved in cell wall biosynthesis